MSGAVEVNGRVIANGASVFIAAEVGINHNGDVDLAHDMIDAAADAGADGVKFQNYRTEDFVVDRSLTYKYISQGSVIEESQYEMFRRCELGRKEFKSLKEHCDRKDVVFFSTPTSAEGVDDLIEIGTPLLKNGSDYLVELDLIARMGASEIPTVLSVGMATVGEIDDAVMAFRGAGGTDLILLQCTSAYPAPAEELNLRRIPVLASTFGCPSGFSDHSDGIVAAVAASVLGACFVEKHFTLDKELPGPDHRFSSDPAELASLVLAIRYAESALGSATVVPTASESVGRREYRLSCIAKRPLPVHAVLTLADIAYARPGVGIAPKNRDLLIGRKLTRAVEEGHAFSVDDFQ